MFVLLFITVWIVGAALCAKADAILANIPTDVGDFCLSLVIWPIVALLIVFTKHECYDDEFHY